MKAFVAVAVLLVAFAAVVRSEETASATEVSAESNEGTIKIYKRLIPADVLRGKYRMLEKINWYKKNMDTFLNLIIKLILIALRKMPRNTFRRFATFT